MLSIETILRTLDRTVGVHFPPLQDDHFWRRVQGRLAHRSLRTSTAIRALVLDQA